MKTKKCSKCERDLPFKHYYNDSKSIDGKQSQCNDCKRIRKKRPSKGKSQKTQSETQNQPEQKLGLATRYSQKELEEFRLIIINKIKIAEESIKTLKASINGSDSNGTEDTGSSLKGIEDGPDILAKEEAMVLSTRQQRFLSSLKDALLRIDRGTYGVCFSTGRLIPKERLTVVPHATRCVESKNEKEKTIFVPTMSSDGEDEE